MSAAIDWAEHYKAVRKRLNTVVYKPAPKLPEPMALPPRKRLRVKAIAVQRYPYPIGPIVPGADGRGVVAEGCCLSAPRSAARAIVHDVCTVRRANPLMVMSKCRV